MISHQFEHTCQHTPMRSDCGFKRARQEAATAPLYASWRDGASQLPSVRCRADFEMRRVSVRCTRVCSPALEVVRVDVHNILERKVPGNVAGERGQRHQAFSVLYEGKRRVPKHGIAFAVGRKLFVCRGSGCGWHWRLLHAAHRTYPCCDIQVKQ